MKPSFLVISFLLVASAAAGEENDSSGTDGIFGPGPGFIIPWLGPVSGVVWPSPSVVCKVKGPCYKKMLTCPAKCFKSFNGSGKGYGYGGGGGGCTMDCKKECIAYC